MAANAEEWKQIVNGDYSLITISNIVEVYTSAKTEKFDFLVQKCYELIEEHVNKPDALGLRFRYVDPVQVWIDEMDKLPKNLEPHRTGLHPSNVFRMLNAAKCHRDEKMESICWSYIDHNVNKILCLCIEEGAYVIKHDEMAALLSRDQLFIQENHLFSRVEKWAIKQCAMDGVLDPTGTEKRGKLAGLLELVRFPLIEPVLAIQSIFPKGILNEAEKLYIYEYYSIHALLRERDFNGKRHLFSDKPRAMPINHVCQLVDRNEFDEEIEDLQEQLEKSGIKELRKELVEMEDKMKNMEEKMKKMEEREQKNMEESEHKNI